ncbi:hypothetical protein PsorP6_011532 [Peronosclerospora sorghi]|uniref:Uncharacterized protein n=1 Tax=Peronosclerospora sorghi TaxID=230839 RepID=A0ACC0WK85_9STRA|nr:hypothetical protein PsorP6_011532 [Peronosclerospora sorghi]
MEYVQDYIKQYKCIWSLPALLPVFPPSTRPRHLPSRRTMPQALLITSFALNYPCSRYAARDAAYPFQHRPPSRLRLSIASRDAVTSEVDQAIVSSVFPFVGEDPDTPQHKARWDQFRSWSGTRSPLFPKKCPSQSQEHHSIALRRQPDDNPALHQQSDC